MPKCSKCGSELQAKDGILQCPNCGEEYEMLETSEEIIDLVDAIEPSEASDNEKIRTLEARLSELEAEKKAREKKDKEQMEQRLATLEAENKARERKEKEQMERRLAELEADKYRRDHRFDKFKSIGNSKAVVYVKTHWKLMLVLLMLFVAFLTLMITLVGLRGIYVNVNNSDDFYDFTATSYRASSVDFLTGEETLEEGKWKIKGDKLVLSIEDELFGKLSDDFDFEKVDGFKRIKIDDDEYKRVSLVGLKTTQKKVKITFDPQNGQAPTVYRVKIGSVFKDEIPEVSNGQYIFEGWFDQPTHEGERCYIEGQRVWEDMDFYAVWHTEHYASAYRHDENYHWQICEFAHCDERVPNSYGSHSFKWQTVKESTCTEYGQQDYACVTCGYTIDTRQLDSELKPHEMSDWKIDGEYTCGDTVTRHKDCANCEYTEVDDHYVVSHVWKEQLTSEKQKECSICGYKEDVYEERGGKIYFGEYPQTKVTDNGISATLAQMSGSRPVKGNRGKWTDYKYYINGNVDEYMWYIDLDYNGARYRGVYFTSYRPYWTIYDSSTGYTHQDDNGYYINTLYWFKWEPIEWCVLERTNSEVFLMSNVILDSQQYYHDDGARTLSGKTLYPNNYKESDIRAWLNGTFYNQAFDEFEQSVIKTTLVDNSASTTANSSNSYACENTNDKVFLLSYKDVLNTKYGFSSYSGDYDTARRLKTTGYAQSQGAYTSSGSSYMGNGWWWLRSPGYGSSFYALSVDDYGYAGYSYDVYYTDYGVVPALRITLY